MTVASHPNPPAMSARVAIKKLSTGTAMLNLACGTITHPAWTNLDFSPYAYLARHKRIAGVLRTVGFISDTRWTRLEGVDPGIVRWDLRRGIPYPDSSFDVVYNSHFLEHLRRRDAGEFLTECNRVLRPGGVIRIAVPDLA